ncbi:MULTISPECIES: nitrile hydratase accessory protein [unclassified Modestobacter]|uniref:nitrile hydratase accessory protein n=1 Tax=unclassified Modestobacter TaxID=2643866 RepID=UPI0022AA1C46|nr:MULTISPECIES: nitrile hydratase accessory protein [unclassified Modestobacter]MCZ2826690.1 nitrile hydratase accessory protein [Modestobacter sp. VKM Ac-2981]MCZ2855070.1 nitrile hydratase accessory protein [Modestobacter sp. VKM Ac-2982]
MSSDVVDFTYDADGKAVFHDSCVTDLDQPTFDAEWQRRAFGLAVALSEFRHYEWTDFQQALIGEIGAWENAPADARGRWEYYEHWVSALHEVVAGHGLLEEGYVNPEDRDDH